MYAIRSYYAEVGRASVILDESVAVKKIIFHPRMLPAVVILDPELTLVITSYSIHYTKLYEARPRRR